MVNTIAPFRLITKLRDLGLSDQLSKWILDFLTGRSQVVRVGNCVLPSILEPHEDVFWAYCSKHCTLRSPTQLKFHRETLPTFTPDADQSKEIFKDHSYPNQLHSNHFTQAWAWARMPTCSVNERSGDAFWLAQERCKHGRWGGEREASHWRLHFGCTGSESKIWGVKRFWPCA